MPFRPTKETEPPTRVICPLVIGNFWVYVDSTVGAYSLQVDTSRLEITGKTTIMSKDQIVEVFLWNWFDNATKKPEDWKWLNRNEKDGLWTYGILSSTDTLLAKTLDIMYPIELNESWKCVLLYENFKVSDTLTVTCVATEDQFITPAGIFKCHVYHYEIPSAYSFQRVFQKYGFPFETLMPTLKSHQLHRDEFFLFLVPNVGYVGLFETINGVLVWKKTLVDYQVRLE